MTDAISMNSSREELLCLARGLLNPSSIVRNTVLLALEPFDLEDREITHIMFLALHDADERSSELASALYNGNALSIELEDVEKLMALLGW
jgi:hypothetical protein